MDNIIIKTQRGKRYAITFDATNAGRPKLRQSGAIRPLGMQQIESILKGARPEKPTTWSALWKQVKPLNFTPAVTKDDEIVEALGALAGEFRLHFKEIAIANPAANSHATGGAKSGSGSSSAGGGSGGSADLGPDSRDKSAAEVPESNEKPYTEENAATSTKATEGGQPAAETECSGDPVSMITGEEMLQFVDVTLPGPMPFTWKRTYRSSQTRDVGLGVAWSHSGSESIEESETEVTYIDDEGRRVPFAVPRNHQRSKYIPEQLNLDRISDTTFILKKEGEWDKVFTRVNAHSKHYRLMQLRHASYVSPKKVMGVLTPETGFCINFQYNDQGRLRRIKGNWGKHLLIERDDAGRVAKVLLHNAALDKQKTVSLYTYNTEGDLIAHRNAKGVGEKYQYANHLLTQRTLVTGFNFYFEWTGTDHTAKVKHNWGDRGIYEYYFDWFPDENRSKTMDSRGFTTEYLYNEYGQIVERKDNEGGLHQFRYSHGRKEAYIDPQGNTTEYFYDRENNPVGMRDALGHDVSIGYFQGRPTSFKDKDKSRWQREYNRKGQLISLKDPYDLTSEYRYNEQGLLSVKTDPMGRKTFYHWDDAGQLIKLIDPSKHARVFRYDAWGQVIESELLINGKDSAGVVKYQYNETGLVERVETAHGEITSYKYNDNDQLIRYSDPQGRTTEFVYDGLSQVIERIDPEGQKLKYEYDSERNLTALINENGERYEFTYDGNERLVKEVGFDGRVQHYKYNAAGHLIKHLDADEILTEFDRDALGNMITKTSSHFKVKSVAPERTRFRYDEKGRLVETYNQKHYLAFEYNFYGNIVKERQCEINESQKLVAATMGDIQFQQIWPGLRSGIQLPDGQSIAYGYNRLNQFTDINLNGKKITHIERDDFGRELVRQQGSIATHSEYDPMGRLAKQVSVNQSNKALGPVQREYGYDKFGNLNQLKDGEYETRFIYDLVNRLEKVEGSAGGIGFEETFDFDPASTILAVNGEPVGKSEGNRLLMQGDRKFTYDARGNLIKENRGKEGKLETQFAYNLQNQLIAVKKEGQLTEYQYDPLGRRTLKKDAFGTTKYTWVGDQLTQEKRKNIKKTYIYEPESFRPVAMVENENVYHYHLDHLGTPKELSDDQGKVVWKARYKTYGSLAVKEVDEVENNLRFQGQYFDEETGLHYNRHRYYNPNTGMFITQDPIGLLGGVNNYLYAPNPVQWVDPLGLKCKENRWNTFQKETKGEYANSKEASQAYQKLKAVDAMDQDIRPNPSSYLPQSYIDAHLAKFDSGASYFAPKWALDRFGRDPVGRADGQFVMTTQQVNEVLLRTGGDMALIEKELGIPEGDWQGQEMVVIEIDTPKNVNLRMPTGRESGANELWLAGGKLPTGHDEAVTDAIPQSAYKEMSIKDATIKAKSKK
ncbi:Putative deoxyribonuclease RhsC [Thalassocella blandensis]|nr:Putative deoxyribonuclease RhsC [Thalassocella blandensis]